VRAVRWFHLASFNEVLQGGLGDADVTANVDEPDAPFCDEAAGETLGRAEQLGDLGHSQEPLYLSHLGPCHYAAFPVAGSSSASAS
jgi:hypothetical protein